MQLKRSYTNLSDYSFLDDFDEFNELGSKTWAKLNEAVKQGKLTVTFTKEELLFAHQAVERWDIS